MGKKECTEALTDIDHLKIEFDSSKGRIEYFVVQYYAKIHGKWQTIMRLDNSHGVPHKHVYHLHSDELKIELDQENSIAFNEAKNYIEENYLKIKENFLFI